MDQKKKIVVLGAGFAGLRAVFELEKIFNRQGPKLWQEYELILVDRHDYQLFTPFLYEIATTPEKLAYYRDLIDAASFNIPSLLAGHKISFLHKEIANLKLEQKKILFSDKTECDFEYLLIALGSETNYFGIPGMEEYSFPLKNLYDALRIRQQIENLFSNPSGKDLTFIVGGAGPTGAEFASTLALWSRNFERKNKNTCTCSIVLLEAAPTILPGLDPRAIKKVSKQLQKLGVKIMTGSGISNVNQSSIKLANNEELDYDLLVWAGGTKANHLLLNPAIKSVIEEEKRGRIEVKNDMECLSPDPHLDFGGKIYAAGDIMCLIDPITSRPFPAVAPAAIEQAKLAARNIFAEITKKEKVIYQHKNYPYAIPCGENWAAIKLKNFVVFGFLGWILKEISEFRYYFMIMPPHKAIKWMFKDLALVAKKIRNI